MCGIAGIVQFDRGPVDAALLDRMTDVLSHRGPDGRGTVALGSVGLGHRRLSIIDLAAGAQPMSTPDGSVWISFNGEIYNYRALRAEYRSRGYHFRTSSDTEVILAAYEADGIDCLRRLRGMFAFAIWDSRRQTLFLARDRLGIKPLVYSYLDGRLLFASELKALLQDPSTPRALDWQALHDYLTLLYVPSPRTIFSAISKLEPGTYLQLSPGRDPTLHRYWALEFAPDLSVREERWVEELSAQLQEAIQLHMVSDVPIGAFLSGGLDSSSVVAHMTALGGSRVRTFAVGFDDDAFNEPDDARIVARHLGTEHHETIVKPDALEVLPSLAWQFDEPFADSSAIPTYYVARATRDHVTVALTGDGGDEAFAGYTRYARANRLHRLMDLSPLLLLRPLLRLTASAVPPGNARPGHPRHARRSAARALHEHGHLSGPRQPDAPARPRRPPDPGAPPVECVSPRPRPAAQGARRYLQAPGARFPDLSPAGYPHEGRSHQHARVPRGQGPPPGPRPSGVPRASASFAQAPRHPEQVSPQAGGRRSAAGSYPHSAKDGVRRALERLVQARPVRFRQRSPPRRRCRDALAPGHSGGRPAARRTPDRAPRPHEPDLVSRCPGAVGPPVAPPSVHRTEGLTRCLPDVHPHSILEAMAASRPVITTRCGGPEELVVHGEAGLHVDAGPPDQIADAIISLLKDDEGMKRMGGRARALVESRFDADSYARNVEEVYTRVSVSRGQAPDGPWAGVMLDLVSTVGTLGGRA